METSQQALTPGLKGEATTTVGAENTASSFGATGVHVYATPAMIGLMEAASARAVQPHLPPGYTTVGTVVNVRHLAATPSGQQVRASAELIEVEGKRLVFRVAAHDEKQQIGDGIHERFIVDLAKFMARLAKP